MQHCLPANLQLFRALSPLSKAVNARVGQQHCIRVSDHRSDLKGSRMVQGEHGTGRNVAPYVEMEWGGKAYHLMWRLKQLFDPSDVLNPGVILNKVRAGLCTDPHHCKGRGADRNQHDGDTAGCRAC